MDPKMRVCGGAVWYLASPVGVQQVPLGFAGLLSVKKGRPEGGEEQARMHP
jgi:hypothetical protein